MEFMLLKDCFLPICIAKLHMYTAEVSKSTFVHACSRFEWNYNFFYQCVFIVYNV